MKSPFHSDLLRCLSVPVDRIEVVFDTHIWHLPRQVAKDWKALENVLVLATKNLHSFFRQNHPSTPLQFASPQLPSMYGYFSTHESESAARSALSVSLNAFAVYLGYFSFIVTICQFGIDPQSSSPSWHKRLARTDSPIHPEWLKLLLDSPIVDFNRERIGVVADVARCQWLHLAKYMMHASVPLWFYWGKSPFYIMPLHSWIRDKFYLGDGDPITVAPTDATGHVLPPVIPQSGQHPGETMEQFFSRRQQCDEKLREKELANQRSSRQAREKLQALRPRPGRKGPSVFYWDDIDGFDRTISFKQKANFVQDFYIKSLFNKRIKAVVNYIFIVASRSRSQSRTRKAVSVKKRSTTWFRKLSNLLLKMRLSARRLKPFTSLWLPQISSHLVSQTPSGKASIYHPTTL